MFTPIVTFFKTSSALTTDIFVLLTLFLIFFLYGWYFGKARIISFLLAFYPAVFFYKMFPFEKEFIVLHGDKLVVFNYVLIFLLFLIPLSIMIGRYIFSDSGFGGSTHYVRIGGFSLAAVILVLIFSYSIINLDIFYNFSPTIDAFFSPDIKLFWWNLAPIALLFVL